MPMPGCIAMNLPSVSFLGTSSAQNCSSPRRKVSHLPSSRCKCFRCSRLDHLPASCRFADYICRKCHKKSHLAKVRRLHKATSGAYKTPGKKSVRAHRLTSAEQEEEQHAVPLFWLGESCTTPIQVDIQVNGVPVIMEKDTGAAVPVMSQQQQEELAPRAQLQPSWISLRTYTAQSVQAINALPVHVTYEEQVQDL